MHYGKEGCWIIKNSWGVFSGTLTNPADFWRDIWHVDGYGYLPYDYYRSNARSVTLG